MIMQRMLGNRTHKQRGFTLIELAIVLAVTSLLTAGLWRMMASGNSQLRDQAAADKQRELITAIRGYLASTNGQAFLKTALPAAGLSDNVTLPMPPTPCTATGVCPFLSPDFIANPVNSYGQGYAVQVHRQVDATGNLGSYSFMIKTGGGEVIPDTSGGRISSMIGNDGGFIYSTIVCTALTNACGAYGTWVASPNGNYEFPLASVGSGQIASRTFVGMTADMNTPWLARMPMTVHDTNADGVDDYNTLSTDIVLGANTLFGTKAAGYSGEIQNLAEITLGRTATAGNPPIVISNTICHRVDVSLTDPCNYDLQINGSAVVSELLAANRLYAAQFIYDENAGTFSDMRLKREITPIQDVLKKMIQISGYSFVMKEGGSTRYGVLAQEVEKVFPSIVTTNRDGYKTVDYMGLVGPLVQSVNQLAEQNEKLSARLEEQAKLIGALQKKIDAKDEAK